MALLEQVVVVIWHTAVVVLITPAAEPSVLTVSGVQLTTGEKADDVVVLPAKGLGWNDIGSWESIYDVVDEDENGNIFINCRPLHLDSNGVLACSENKDKMIITVGMKDIVVVETDKAVMVCPKHDTQRVKEIVQYLKDNHLDSYL